MKSEINNLKIDMNGLKKDIGNLTDKMTTHISDQKETDKKVDGNFNKIFEKIDNLSDTFEVKVQSKADHKEVITRFDDMDKRYAPYFIYKVLIWMAAIIVGSVLLGLVALIGKAYLKLY